MKNDTLSPAQLAEVCDRLKAIANQKRMAILLLLLDGKQRTVNEIAKAVGMAQPTASEHLKMLKEESGFLLSRKDGKQVYYTANQQGVFHFVEAVYGHLRDCCPK